MGDKIWQIATTGAAIGAGIMAKKVTESTWKFVTGGDSPSNPEDPDIDWVEAIAFALVSGAIYQLARMLTNRESARMYQKSTGHLPKPLAKKES
ncbi:hypothetical protein BH24ACT8_BH24ACT8_17930 [soil metagenome]|jgi:hypothetical protein